MAVEPDDRDFDRPNLRLSPEMHRAQAEMAAEHGREYGPYEFERQVDERVEESPGPIADADLVERSSD